MESLKNIFTVSELRNRVLVHARAAGRLPRRPPHSDTRREYGALAELARQAANTMFGLYDMFSAAICRASRSSRWASCPTSARRSSCSCGPSSGRTGAVCPRKAISTPEDHAVHALRNDSAECRAIARHRGVPRAADADRWRASRLVYHPGLGFRLNDGAHVDGPHHVHSCGPASK